MSQPKLSFTSHIGELRRRLTHSVIALVVTTGISFAFSKQIFQILIRPAPDGVPLIYTDVTEMIGTYMKVSLAAGVVLAMPIIVYHILMFVSPALTPKEKRYVYVGLPFIVFMFLGGVAFGYFILIPPAMKFLLTFGNDIATPMIRIGNYISIVTRLLLVIGGVFELPVIILFLAKIGVVSSKWLGSKRKWAIVGAFVLSAIITPTVDPVNQSLVAGPLIVLYEISIWLSKLVEKKKPKPAATTITAESQP